MVNVGFAVPDVGKVMSRRTRDCDGHGFVPWRSPPTFCICSHPGGAHYVASAFRIGNMPDVSGADSEKQLLMYFAGRRQGGRCVIVQSEVNAGLWDADRIRAVEVWSYSVFRIEAIAR